MYIFIINCWRDIELNFSLAIFGPVTIKLYNEIN